MVCPNCQAVNREESRFCDNCGFRLQVVCPQCQTSNRPDASFCRSCGQPLGAAPAAAGNATETGRVGAVQTTGAFAAETRRFIPPEVLARLEAVQRHDNKGAERRVVSMLFSDLKGSTAAAHNLDPEEWTEIINAAFEHMIRPVYRYEGTVVRLMGDGLLAFFGAPLAHEDDPQRAVLAGLEIIEGIKAYCPAVQRRWGMDLAVRVGINTGLVVVGAVGSDLRMEYTAIGDAINLAARMEQTAQPGTVQLSHETYRLVAAHFDFEDLGGVEVKGRDEPVHAYRVLGRKVQPASSRGLQGLASPLVGREQEFEKLRSALAGLRQGQGQIIALIGEAGLGKSRLIAETRALWERSESGGQQGRQSLWPAWSESQGISYDTGRPYLQFQQHVRCLANIAENESPDAVRGKLAELCARPPLLAKANMASVLSRLLVAETGVGAGAASLMGEVYKVELFDAVQQLWQAWSTQSPAVCVFDDLHWTDQASLELLLHLLSLVEDHPILFLCIFRPDPPLTPDFGAPMPGAKLRDAAAALRPQRYQEIHLNPLSTEDSGNLVDNLLSVSQLPDDLRQLIYERSDGNPFFVEEIIRTLIESHIVVRNTGEAGGWRMTAGIDPTTIIVPDNLQSLLMARIDRLDESARQILQVASVIGRRFMRSILAALAEPTLGIDWQLDTLQRTELIHQAAQVPELEYMFRHSLTHEATYGTILLKSRREFHRRVGEAVEQLFSTRLEEFYAVLAHHFHEARDPRAFRYSILAGDAAFHLYALSEALHHYDLAVMLAQGNAGVLPEDLIHLYLRRGRSLELKNDYAAALANYGELQDLATDRDDARMELAALQARAIVHAIPTNIQNLTQGWELARQAMALARRLGDRGAEARVLWNFQLLCSYAGRMSDAIPYGEQAATLAAELGLDELRAHALQDLALPYMGVGQHARARAVLDQAAQIWKALGNRPMLAENYANSAYVRVITGHFEEGMSEASASLQLSRSIRNDWGEVNSRVFIGMVHLARADLDRAQEEVSSLIANGDRLGHPGAVLGRVEQAWIYAGAANIDREVGAWREAVAASTRFPPFQPLIQAAHARFLLAHGDLAAPEELVAEVADPMRRETLFVIEIEYRLAVAEITAAHGSVSAAIEQVADLVVLLGETQALYFMPETLQVKARLLREQGRLDEARAALEQAEESARSLGARSRLWTILTDLGDLEEQAGATAAAQAHMAEAAHLVQEIAATLSADDLRTSLLSSPKAQRALASLQ